jgi:Toprim domain
MTLGSMGGCVIRLWPDIGTRLVLGEGVESTLAAATRITHRGKPLRPAWAAGCAGNMRKFPVLEGIEELILLVDNDSSGTGQRAAAECAERWCAAGRRVIRLTPPEPDTDFNDLIMNR